MSRKISASEKSIWENPLKDAEPKPYLADEIWPDDPQDPKWDQTISILERFYCSERDKSQENINQLRRYLADPEKYMILWGEVGIGKTWFIRYELLAGENSTQKKPYHAGIIDMLSEKDAEYGVYKQLRHIIEMYFQRYCGGTINAIQEYVKYDFAKLKLKSPSELTEAELEDIKIIAVKWLELRYGTDKADVENYSLRLLDVLQYVGKQELVMIVVDNIDKTEDDDQERLVKLAVRILRHPQIRLIIPLRRSSRILRNRFSVLKEFTYDEMELTPINIQEMLRLRFQYSREGRNLTYSPKVNDALEIIDPKEYSFPFIFNYLFYKEKQLSDAGKLLLTIIGSNAREALGFLERLIYSEQLKGLKNINNPEYVVAALMLKDSSKPYITSCIVNLFDNEDPNFSGNALIRFRVMEYFWNDSTVDPSDDRFQNHFTRLGYDFQRVVNVLELFLMTQLIVATKGYSPETLRTMTIDQIGQLTITDSGKELRNLLNRQWYFISARRDIYLPENIIKVNDSGGEYCTHTDFINWLKEQEEKERRAINEYVKVNGEYRSDWGLSRPSKIAEQVLKPPVLKKERA